MHRQKTALFLRHHKSNGSKAWEILCRRLKSAERPRLQQLDSDLTWVRIKADESVVEYITRAEELQNNLNELDEGLSGRCLCQSFLKFYQKSSLFFLL